jgi:hypothetical protein
MNKYELAAVAGLTFALNVVHNYAQYANYHALAENYDAAAYHVC